MAKSKKVTDSDAGSCEEGLSKILHGGHHTGYHPTPPPIPHGERLGPRTRGPRRPELIGKEGPRGFRRTTHADVKRAS